MMINYFFFCYYNILIYTKKCVPNKPTTPPQTCRYQYNQKTKTCKVISRGCTLEGFYSSTYKKCIPRCRNGQRYDNRSESCK